jgi:hypothetical protein
MSKKLYFGILAATFVLMFLCGLPALFLLNSYQVPRDMGIDDDFTNLIVAALGFLALAPFVLTLLILPLVVIYKMWASISDGNHARMSAGKAIGFLFIPFFNLYWLFQVWGGFPTDYNNYIERHRLNISPLGSGIYTAYPVLIVLSVIPFLNILTSLAAVFVFLVIMSKTSDAVNRLADASENQGAFVSQISAGPRRAIG